MNLHDWAARWGVPREALAELAFDGTVGGIGTGSESSVMADVRVEASRVGARLWRNNVGAGHIVESGSFLRWGLCNESEAMNRAIKSSDLIGVRPVLVEPRHVGTTIGQFVARETKRPGWKWSGTPREEAQLRFVMLVQSLGGDACFAAGKGSFQ